MMCPGKETGTCIKTRAKRLWKIRTLTIMIDELLGSVICYRNKPLQCFLHFSFDLRDSELHATTKNENASHIKCQIYIKAVT